MTDDDARPWADDRALAVDTSVREVSGQWVVEIVVVFPDGVVRRTIATHRSRRRAEIAAEWIRRGADRDLDAPPDG